MGILDSRCKSICAFILSGERSSAGRTCLVLGTRQCFAGPPPRGGRVREHASHKAQSRWDWLNWLPESADGERNLAMSWLSPIKD
jgi:hypothetical protein